MATTLTEARATVWAGVLHQPEGDGLFNPERIDRAIRFAGNDFVRATRCTHTHTTASLSTSSHVIDLSSALTRGENMIWAHIDGYPVKQAPLFAVQRYFQGSTPTGRPSIMAFETPARTWIYPEPDQSYTLSYVYAAPFTSWTIGTNAPDGVTLNIPDQYIDPVLRFGAATALIYSDPQALYAQAGWIQYEKFRNEVAAVLNPGAPQPEPVKPATTMQRPMEVRR